MESSHEGSDRSESSVFAVAEITGVDTPVWLASRATGLTSSTDQGESWHDALSSLELSDNLTVASLACTGIADRDEVFAGSLGGILHSTSGGQTWTVATLQSPPPYVVDICVSPNYRVDGLVFAATLEDGVFRSWDRGAGWASWNFGLLDLNAYCLVASAGYEEDETLFVGVESGVFYSKNGGRAWRETKFPMEAAPVLSLAAMTGSDGTQLLLAGTESHGLLVSPDDGNQWEQVDLPPVDGAINQLLVDTTTPVETCFAITADVILRTDNGLDWYQVYEIDGKGKISASTLLQYKTDAILIGTTNGLVQSVHVSA